MEIVRDEYARPISPRPGAIDLVVRLRGRVPLGIASNTALSLVRLALASAPFGDAFDSVVSADEVARPKPAPDVYLETCRRLAVEPAEAIGLEDSTSGIAAAKAAGLTVIVVPQWSVVDTSAADHVISSLTELMPGSGDSLTSG